MSYYVYKSGKSWDLKFQEGKNNRHHVPKTSDEARLMGFSPKMTLEEARARAKQVQSEAWVKTEAKKQAKSRTIIEKQKKLRSAYLTDPDAEEFEQKYLSEYKIQRPHWHTMQKIIIAVELHPSEWFEQKSRLFQQFKRFRCSPNYAKKLLRYLNLWGYFLCKKQGRAFLKVPGLDGTWRNRLEESRRPGGQSLPLSPELLEEKRSSMSEENFRWLFISVWFGLRPREVDNLLLKNRKDLWVISADEQFDSVLSIFQEKLFERGVLKRDCWKHVPTVFPQQRLAIKLIQEGKFSRPCGAGGKFMQNTFGKGYSNYAGRNNFSGMLRDNGYDLETRKHWMGHLSVKTTEAYDRKTMRGQVFYNAPVRKKVG